MVSYIISFIIISFSLLNNSYALGGRKILQSNYESINFTITSFLSTECKPSVQGGRSRRRPASLEVTHRDCSKSSPNDNNFPTLAEMIGYDQARVASIQNQHGVNKGSAVDELAGDWKATTVPVKSGITFGFNAHVVTIGLGTPAKELNVLMDTGSSLTWTQCKPCTGNCYAQKDPIFDPSASTSYSNSSCHSTQCSHLSNSNFYIQSCSPEPESTCVYKLSYVDNSFSKGYLGNERLTLTPNEVFDNFPFGCGEDNEGISDQRAGILGLGPDYYSLISQTSAKYDKYFSYCLPTRSGSNGHLTLGNDNWYSPSNLVYTPLTIDPQGEHYAVNIVGITVGRKQLEIDPSVFTEGGTVIDSGSTFTHLPPTAYIALRDAFKQYNPTVPSFSSDACYHISNNHTIHIPEISFIFAGNAKIHLAHTGILVPLSPSQVCLAFTPNNKDTDTTIFGNLQQQTFEVVYDVAGGRLGFGHAGCS